MDADAPSGSWIGPGETVVWTGRPRVGPRPFLSVAPIAVPLGLLATFIGSQGPATSLTLGFAVAAFAAPFVIAALRLWQVAHTTYLLTGRNLYVDAPMGRRVVRLTSLPALRVIDEGDGCGTILIDSAAETRSTIDQLRWVTGMPDALLWSIPDAEAVRRRIVDRPNDEPEALMGGAAGVFPAPSNTDPFPWATLVMGGFWVAIGSLMATTYLASGLPALSAAAVPFLALPITFAVAGVAIAVAPFATRRRRTRLRSFGQLGFATVVGVREQRPWDSKRLAYALDYRYEVLGREHTGVASGLSFELAHLAGVGDQLLIRFDPQHPERSVWTSA